MRSNLRQIELLSDILRCGDAIPRTFLKVGLHIAYSTMSFSAFWTPNSTPSSTNFVSETHPKNCEEPTPSAYGPDAAGCWVTRSLYRMTQFSYCVSKSLTVFVKIVTCARGPMSRDRDQDRGVEVRGRGETEALEASVEARPRRGVGRPRGGLETEAPRPRPHPCWPLYYCCRQNKQLLGQLVRTAII